MLMACLPEWAPLFRVGAMLSSVANKHAHFSDLIKSRLIFSSPNSPVFLVGGAHLLAGIPECGPFFDP